MTPRVSGGVDKDSYVKLDGSHNSTEFAPSQHQEQETIFRLSELLKLQVSIAGSLEMARLAFRHADPELAEATRQTSRQARDLFQHAANVVSRYAQVSQQVSQFVLPDLALAVQEGENPAGFFDIIKDWVVEMKTEGERTQQRYGQLQASVESLVRRAQETKTGADRRLFEAVRAVEAEPSLSSTSGSEEASKGLVASCSKSDVGGRAATTSGSGMQDLRAGAVMEIPPFLNSWTRQLFEQLSELTAGSGTKSSWDRSGDIPAADMDPRDASVGTTGMSDDDTAWRRDLIDLLFLAPGVAPSSLPKLEAFNFATDSKDDEVPSYDGVHVEDDIGDSGGTAQRSSEQGQAVVTREYIKIENVKSEAETATHSSAALLRALRELKRVDSILQGCSAFWANMDGTLHMLAQMKEHTAILVHHASKSTRLRQRFEQRLKEYMGFWDALERLCRQYCQDHQMAAGRMNEFIREMSDAADLIDSAESAKAGVVLAGKQKTLSQHAHGYSMDVYQESGQ